MIRAVFVDLYAGSFRLRARERRRQPLAVQALGGKSVWIPSVRNSTDSDLRFPGANPLRSLGEMAGKVSPDYRPDSDGSAARIRAARNPAAQGTVRFPEERDGRLQSCRSATKRRARNRAQGGLAAAFLLSEIRRWHTDAAVCSRLWVEFKLVRIEDGAVSGSGRSSKQCRSPAPRIG